MKLVSIKRIVGLAALYGAVQYARRHGGPKNAFNELLGKAKEKVDEAKTFVDEANRTADAAGGSNSDFAAGSGSFASADRIGGPYTRPNGSGNGRRGY